MNIPSTPPSDPTANATAATAAGNANANAAPAAGNGFLALIGALLQGTSLPGSGLPGATGEAGTPELALAGELPLLEGAPLDDEPVDGEDTDDLLASLGLPSLLTPQIAPPPLPPTATSAAPVATGGEAAMVAAASALPAAIRPPVPKPATAVATNDAAATAARLVPAADDGAAVETLAAFAITAAGGGEEEPARDSTGGSPSNSLHGWAAAAGRIAGGASDVAVRTTGVPTDGALRESVGTPRWKDELGTHLTLMAVKGQQSGSLRLSPEHLGPVEIQITVADDKTTSVQFGAQHAETRAALQDALPRLREMFSAAGLQLGDTGVSHQASRQQENPASAAEQAGVGGPAAGSDGEPTRAAVRVSSITHSGLLDTYA